MALSRIKAIMVTLALGAGTVDRSLTAKLQEQPSLGDLGTVPNAGGNLTAKFVTAITRATAALLGFLRIPVGNWRLTDELTLSNRYGLLGEHRVVTSLTLEGAGDYGINVAGAGIGGSATDGIEIGRLNLWGGKGIALLRVNGTALFHLHDLVAQNNTSGNIVRFTQSQDGLLDNFDFLQCGGVAPYSQADGAVVYYGPACNNIYSRYGRFEAPRNTAIYVDGANTVRYIGGKIDGSAGGANLTLNPFVVVNGGSISFTDYTVTGFQNYPYEVRGSGVLDFSGGIGNGKAPALFLATAASYTLFLRSGGSPGVILKPSIRFRGNVAFTSQNTPANIVGAVISLLAPDPLLKPNAGNSGRVQVASAFDTGGGLWQAALKEWNGSAFVTPTVNDVYTGGWLVDSTTGNAFGQIVTQSGGLVQFRPSGLTYTGTEHFVQYDNVHGVRVDIQVDAPAYSKARWATRLAELKTSVTTTGAAYNGAGYTTVQLSAAVANDTLVGCFLYNKAADAYYYISANSGMQLLVMHDRSTNITNGTYEVVIGNPKAGAGVTINWS